MPDRDEYTVGWICAIGVELVAAKLFFDERYDQLEEIPLEDNNIYALGRIGPHNVVVASLPHGEYGTEVAGTVARDLLRSFPSIKIGLMVGIGGGVPSAKHDIRLGDVVVSATINGEPGVFQYDFGKTIQDMKFQHTKFLDQTPQLLRGAVAYVRSEYDIAGHQLQRNIDAILEKNRKVRRTHQRPPRDTDRLYVSDFVHQPGTDAACEESCGDDESICRSRPPRDKDEDDPAIHYGLIASGNTLMRDAQARDRLARSKDVLCFEMEAAGLMNHFPCLVIRGICDYADSHKKKGWQGYASMTAAAYAKDVLSCIPARQVHLQTTIADALDALGKDMNEILDGTHERDRVNILDWITSKDYGPEHSDRLEQGEKGTGQWFLDSETFKEWLKSDSKTLFCPGIPGAGKTVLASIVIDHIGSNLRSRSDASLGYVYFDHNQKEQHDAKAVIASLVKQLAASHSVLPDTVRKLYEAHHHTRTRPSLDELTQCLRALVEARSKVFIVADALDECTDGSDEVQSRPLHKFLDVIFQLQATHNVNILATSRFIPNIGQRFDATLCQEIRASPDDIRSYVSTQVQQMGGKIQGDDELQEAIQETILGVVDGMFLMARLYIQSLHACMMTKRKVKEALERFARQEYASDTSRTHRAYDEAVMRIDSQNKEYQAIARRALLWITYAERSLTTDELTHALAVERGKPSFDEDNMARIEDVVSVCAGLVALDDASGIIRLVHHTAYEYFRETRSDWFPETHSEITSTCVTYISYEVFASEETKFISASDVWVSTMESIPESGDSVVGSGDSVVESCDAVFGSTDHANLEDPLQWIKQIRLQSLYSYAATYWGHHARRAGASTVDAYMINFLENTRQVNLSCSPIFVDRRSSDQLHLEKTRTITGIHLASYFGIQEAVRQLLMNGADINQDDGAGWTPLCYAVYSGHEAMIGLLLEHDIQTRCSGESISKALNLAVERSQEKVALRLLERGANIDGDKMQTICTAAANGLYSTVERLLGLGADIHSAYRDSSPLCAAAARGQGTVVKLLLERGVQIDAVYDPLGTALNQAAENGKLEVVALLLDHGADPELSYRGETPLLSATRKGHLATVRLLIERGADIEAMSEVSGGRTPFFQAMASGHTNIARFLVRQGADINSPNLKGDRPLEWAAGLWRSNIMQQLLDYGADIEAIGKCGRSALHGAAKRLDDGNLQLLLARGANVHATNDMGDTPLHEAASYGHEANMQLLIDYGANHEAANSRDSTPLHKSAHCGSYFAVRLLLRRRANVNAVDRLYGTPLCYACYTNKLMLVQLLIESGADVNIADDWGNTPLLCAVSALSEETGPLLYPDREALGYVCRWRGKVIQILIDSGANIATKNALGNTVLHIAAEASYERAISALIQLGADVDARNKRGETALYLAGLRRSKLVRKLSAFRSHDRGDSTMLLDGNSRSEVGDNIFMWTRFETSSSSPDGSIVSFDGNEENPPYGPLFRLEAMSRKFSLISMIRRNTDAFNCLLNAGADIDATDANGVTLLWYLSSAGDAKFLRQLLHHGANTEATDSCRRTALHVSVSNGDLGIVELLLDHGAEIEAVDEEGRTPLWAAAWSGETGIVQLLLEYGARLEVMDVCGQTPLQAAVIRGHDDVERILRERGARDDDCFGFQRLFCEGDEASPDHSTGPS